MAALLYVGCVLVMACTDGDTQIRFFNSLLHGIDVTSILRTAMPVREMLLGLVQTFALAWLVGAAIASIYNVSAPRTDATRPARLACPGCGGEHQ